VVEVAWVDARHQRASLKLHFATSGRWVERFIGFASSDADTERGRTLGFAIASIVPPEEPATESSGSSTGSAAGGVPTVPLPALPIAPNPGASQATPNDTARGRARPEHTPPVEERPSSWSRWTLDATADGALNGNATGLGGVAALQWLPAERVALRLGAGLREAQLSSLPSNIYTAQVWVGVAFRLVEAGPHQPFGAAVRLDYAEVDPIATRPAPRGGGSTAHNFGLFSGVDLVAEGAWRFAPPLSLLVGAGVEDVNGVTPPVKVHDDGTTAVVPSLRFVASLGVRLEL
jgi:hypothetical protein